jgi:hypothetical protein
MGVPQGEGPRVRRLRAVLGRVLRSCERLLASRVLPDLSTLGAAAFLAAGAPPLLAEQSFVLVVSGLAGEAQYAESFHEWSFSMVDAARKLGLDAESVVWLAEKPEKDPSRIKERSTRENVLKAMAGIAEKAQPGDFVLVLLIGHGSFQAGESRFNLPGPDITAADFARLLERFSSQKLALVNAARARGEWVKALSGRNRAIVTATKSGMERNDTVFGRFFVEAFAGAGADADKDQRVSVLEAFEYARREVARHYQKDNRLLTEHAQLDDDGDGAGSAELQPRAGDGALARTLFLGAGDRAADSGAAAADPRVASLQKERRAIEERIEALKAQKDGMGARLYEEEMGKLLLELALKSEAIRAASGRTGK